MGGGEGVSTGRVEAARRSLGKECGRQVNSASVTVLGELDALHDQLNRLVVPENFLSLKCVQGSRDRVAPTDAEICLRLECAGDRRGTCAHVYALSLIPVLPSWQTFSARSHLVPHKVLNNKLSY